MNDKQIIVSGKFTEKGNYTGYNVQGLLTDRVHIPERLMTALGLTKDTRVPTLYAIVGPAKFSIRKEVKNSDTGEITLVDTGDTFTRCQAGSIFLTKAEMINAYNSSDLLETETKIELRKSALTLGLTDVQVEALHSSAAFATL